MPTPTSMTAALERADTIEQHLAEARAALRDLLKEYELTPRGWRHSGIRDRARAALQDRAST